VATLYATANGASGAAVIIDGYRVEVEASTAAQMFFAGIVGINSVDVSAVAEAECGCADSPCSVFPMAFDLPTWEDVGCEQEFYVWDDAHVDEDICDTCDCSTIPLSVVNIGPGQRGWLRLDEPEEEWNAADCGGDCGAASLKCWILNNFGAPIDALCVPGKTGVDASAVHAVEDRLDLGDPFVNILLWDRECAAGESVFGDCPGTLYHIAGFGRVELLDVLTLTLDCRGDVDDCKSNDCPKNVKVIRARKICDWLFQPCSGLSGSGHPCPGGYTAVALIR